MAPLSPFAKAIEAFIDNLRESEDHQTPFYQELLKVAARLRYHDDAAEQSSFSANALQAYVENLDKEQTKHGKMRRVGKKLQPLITGLMQFTHAMDTMIQSGPAPAMLIYGGAMLVLRLVQNFADCFDKMVDAMHDIGTMLECYHIMSQTYASSDVMCAVLVNSYKSILTFWQEAAKLFNRNGVKTLFRGVVKPFEAEWTKLRSSLELDRKKVADIAQALEGSAAKRREEEAKLRDEKLRQQALERRMRLWISGVDDVAQIDVRMDLEPIQKARHVGTCKWIFEDPCFQKWLTSPDNESLWLHANPGTGKSVLCSTIIQQLQRDNKKVAYFFCSFKDPLKRKFNCALKSLALQLLGLYDDVPTEVERIFRRENHHGHTKLQNPLVVQEVLQALLKTLDRVHIILDGLDECEGKGNHRESMTQLLKTLFNAPTLGIVKWLWTSRPELEFQQLTSQVKGKFIYVQKSQVEDDIRIFVEANPEMATGSHKSVGEWVVAAEGNFLWLTIMLRTLTGCDLTCPADVQEELDRFPKGLTQCYQRVLDQLAKKPKLQQELARKLFLLVAFAEQPLTLHETLDALSVDENSGKFSPDRRPFEHLVKQLCCPLISMDPIDKNGRHDLVLRYFHKSTRDFFLQDPTSLDITDSNKLFFSAPEQGHLSMSKLCMGYLSNDRYCNPILLDPANDTFVEDHGFMRYAALFWHRHLSYAGYCEHLFDLAKNFVKSTNFWSCVRVQAMVAPYLFGRLADSSGDDFTMIDPNDVDAGNTDYFASPLPDWLEDSAEGLIIVQAYVAFIREWQPILLRQPQAALQCHPEVLGSNNAFSVKGVEYLDGCIASLRAKSSSALEFHTPPEGQSHTQILGRQTTKSGLRIFSAEKSQESNSANLTLKQWHANIGSRNSNGTTEIKQKRSWDVKFSTRLPLLQLRVQKDVHEPAVWFFDPERFDLSVCHAGEDKNFNPPPEIRQSWLDATCSSSLDTPTHHIIYTQPRQDGHYLVFSILWKLNPHLTGSETDIDSDDSDDSNSDVSDDDSTSSGSEPSRNLGSYGRSRRGSYFGLVIAIEGDNEPVWSSWTSKSGSLLNFIVGHSSKRSLLAWPIDQCLVQYTCLKTRVSGQLSMPPLDLPTGSETRLRDLHFSSCGTVLHCLTVTVRQDLSTKDMVYDIVLNRFALASSERDVLKLTKSTLDLGPISVTYTTHPTVRPATILRSWTDDWVYVAINSSSSLCTVKILRLPLSEVQSADACLVQALSKSTYVPASFSARSPTFDVWRISTEEHIAFTLQSSATGCSAEGNMFTTPGPATVPSIEPIASSDGTPPLVLPATLITRIVAHPDSWRAWDTERDGKEPESYLDVKGDYAAADQAFQVPIRSGLNWRRAVTVSCW